MKGLLKVLLLSVLIVFGSAAVAGHASATTPDQLHDCKVLSQAIIKADGSILAAGLDDSYCYSDIEYSPSPILVQLRADGSVDPGFSNGGVRILNEVPDDSVVELLDAGDGGAILVTRTSLIKVKADGSLDPSFSGDGIAPDVTGQYLDIHVEYRGIGDARVQPDGKIVVAGGLRVARFDANGGIDNTFSGDGVAEGVLPGGTNFQDIKALTLDQTGRIIVAGGNSVALRFSSIGVQDMAFGGNSDGLAVGFPAGSYGVDSVFVEDDGTIRVYGAGYTAVYSMGSLSVFDPDGIPDANRSRSIPAYSYAYAENRDGDVTWSEQESRGEVPNFNLARSKQVYSLTPGPSSVAGIEYSPDNDSFYALGSASTNPCCDGDKAQLVVAKLDGYTFSPDWNFGSEGAAVFPENECAYGIDVNRPHPFETGWNRCRVSPPAISGKISFHQVRRKRPWIKGKINLSAADARPYFIGRQVSITLPQRLRLRSGAVKARWSAEAGASDDTQWISSGRTLTLTSVPKNRFFNIFGDDIPENRPTGITFQLRPGALKPIGKKIRRTRLKFRIEAENFPAGENEEDSSRFFESSNSTSRVLRFRPAPNRKRR